MVDLALRCHLPAGLIDGPIIYPYAADNHGGLVDCSLQLQTCQDLGNGNLQLLVVIIVR